MRTLKIFTISLLSLFSTALIGQVNGNGQLASRAYQFEDVAHLALHISVKAKLDLSLNDEFVIITDENIFEHLKIKQRGGQLLIDQQKWIEPTSIEITAGLKGLQKITSSAWGSISIINMEQPNFEANMEVGHLHIEGSVVTLKAQVGAGSIDARKLLTKVLQAKIDHNGRILTDNAERIELAGNGYGQFIYDRADVLTWKDSSSGLTISTLEEFEIQESNKTSVTYIDVKLQNNSKKKVNIFFRGPIDAPFGYGIPIGARNSKKKTLPVGTRIYKETLIGKDELLLTITAENEGKTVALFAQ